MSKGASWLFQSMDEFKNQHRPLPRASASERARGMSHLIAASGERGSEEAGKFFNVRVANGISPFVSCLLPFMMQLESFRT